jgi:hypothetical protein
MEEEVVESVRNTEGETKVGVGKPISEWTHALKSRRRRKSQGRRPSFANGGRKGRMEL